MATPETDIERVPTIWLADQREPPRSRGSWADVWARVDAARPARRRRPKPQPA